MPIKLNSTGGGSVTIDVPVTASTYTVRAPAVSANLVSDNHTGSVAVTGTISATGRLLSSTTSQNYAVSNATSITVNTTTPTTIASVTITTTGKPVLLVATGDANPGGNGDWHFLRIDRDGSQVGKLIIDQTSSASYNNPFALSHIDTPAAGTYTYTLKAYQGSGAIGYGETSNIQAPTILAVELI